MSHRDLHPFDSVGVEYRLDGGLFSLRRLLSKTKTSSALFSAIQNADDAAFHSLTADGHQPCLDVISETYLHAGLIVNTTISEVLNVSSPDAPKFFHWRMQPNNSENFVSNLSFFSDLINEIQRRSNLASSAFDCLYKCVFGSINISLHTKIAVYNAVVISTMSYSCESRIPYRRHYRLLVSFHI